LYRRYDAIWPDEAPAGLPPEPPAVADGFYREYILLVVADRWLLPGPTWQEQQ
jgi:hypothetical protein